jgi:hypothetical protein
MTSGGRGIIVIHDDTSMSQALQSGAVAYFTKLLAGREQIRAIRPYQPAA